MRAAEHRRRNEKAHRAPGKIRPAVFAFLSPRPPLESSTTLMRPVKVKNPRAEGGSRVLEVPISHGASPVASALGIRSGATLRGPHQPNMASPGRLSKQDISTLLGIGHFYFALTVPATPLRPARALIKLGRPFFTILDRQRLPAHSLPAADRLVPAGGSGQRRWWFIGQPAPGPLAS